MAAQRLVVNPIVRDLWDNWQTYGFNSSSEAGLYAAWVTRQGIAAHLQDGDALAEVGYNGLSSVADLLRRYPKDEFEADQDIRAGRTMRFPNIAAALAYLDAQK